MFWVGPLYHSTLCECSIPPHWHLTACPLSPHLDGFVSRDAVVEVFSQGRGCFQDPMNPNETVIVIRSLVPGGVAQVDGRLIPGDRLLFVNDTGLENASLDQAVQALKGAPKGVVRIGVAKPLPIPDSVSHSQVSEDHAPHCTPTTTTTMHHIEYYSDVHQQGDQGGLVKSESF